MKRVIKKIFLFYLPIILLSYPLDKSISNYLKQSNTCYGEYEVWNDIYSGKINADIAIYGSSRAWVGISPKILSDSLNQQVYNFGLDGHSFWLQYLRHLEYFKNNKHPKHIVLAVDFNSLQKRSDLYLYKQFLPYMLWNKDIKNFTKSYKGFSTLEYDIPLIRYFGESLALKESLKVVLNKNTEQLYRNKGYKGINKNWTTDFDKAKKQMSSYKVSLDNDSVKLLKLFLSECKKNNIKLTIIYTPEYIKGQHFIDGRNEVIMLYQSYANEFNIHFLDYSVNNICYNKDFFYNSTHLNKKGSEIFSKILAQDLLELEKYTY